MTNDDFGAGPEVKSLASWGNQARPALATGNGFDMETASPAIDVVAEQPHKGDRKNCQSWSLSDTRPCPALNGREATIGYLRSGVHSFKGKIPDTGGRGYQKGDYSHYENRYHCDGCGHGCLDG